MNIVFIVGSYYPNYSAVGKCVGNVAEVLSREHNVTIISEKTHINELDNEHYNGQRILRVLSKEKYYRLLLKEKITSSNSLTTIVYKFFDCLQKVYYYSRFILSKVSVKYELVNEYINALKNIDEDVDVIIPACMPIEAVVAADEFRKNINKKMLFCPYIFDNFAKNKTLHRNYLNGKLKERMHLKIEKNIFMTADHIFSIHTLRKHFENEFPEISKISYLEHPLLVNSKSSKIKNGSEINISYIGGLYKKYVEPSYLLKLFHEIDDNRFSLNFYVIGNNFTLLDQYCKLDTNKIFNHGSVDKDSTKMLIENSNILVSISEVSGEQMSSKIFDYISYGKPIVHFYRNKEDINIKILERYPIALCINENEGVFYENVSTFHKFCIEKCNTKIDFLEVEKIFPEATPKYNADIFSSVIGNLF